MCTSVKISTLLLQIVFISLLQTGNASATASSVSYTAGITEEKCVLEEEFHGASSLSTHHDEHAWWDDDGTDDYCEDEPTDLKTAPQKSRNHRWRVWKNKRTKQDTSESTLTKSDASITTMPPLEEHPMRTDEWEFDIQLSRLFSQEADLFPENSLDRDGTKRGKFRKRQVMQFARNGYVKIVQDEQLTSNNMDASFVSTAPNVDKAKRSQVQVGKWRIAHSGVVFDIPVNVQCPKGDTKKMTVLHYHADIHLNKFGEQPRMFRGVITRDRWVSTLI